VLEDNVKAIIKPQYVDHIPKVGYFSMSKAAPVVFSELQG
jgi:translation initiation factor RLI1